MTKSCGHSELSDQAAGKILSEKGLKKTQGKIKILQQISLSHKPLSAQEIHSKLKESCDVSTIFRTLTQFKEKSLIKEVNLDEGFLRYEMGPSEESHHHHHVRCRKCGDIKNIEKCNMNSFNKAIMELGFSQMEHRLEFTGICSKCLKS